MRHDLRFLIAGSCFALAGCVSFSAPEWSAKVLDKGSTTGARTLSISSTSDVEYYLDLHARAYDKLIKSAETGSVLLEFPVVAAAVAVPAGVALGKSDKFVIKASTVGVAGAAGTSWLQPRQRMIAAVQGRSAITCIKREYVLQQGYQSALLSLTRSAANKAALRAAAEKGGNAGANFLRDESARLVASTDALLAPLVEDNENGRVAIAAADDTVSKVKLRLANIGAAPDFTSTISAIREQYKTARAREEAVTEDPVVQSLFAGSTRQLERAVEQVSEYSLRVAECVGKVP